jgi:hypothetical protein
VTTLAPVRAVNGDAHAAFEGNGKLAIWQPRDPFAVHQVGARGAVADASVSVLAVRRPTPVTRPAIRAIDTVKIRRDPKR